MGSLGHASNLCILFDPSKSVDVGEWHPANDSAIKLSRCVESLRDLKFLYTILHSMDNPISELRHIKSIAIPLCNLTEAISSVYGEIDNSHKKELSKKERKAFTQKKESFQNSTRGYNSVKIVRDKIAAHLDVASCVNAPEIWRYVDLRTFSNLLVLCLNELLSLLTSKFYAWSNRTCTPNHFKLMAVDGVLLNLELTKEGEFKEIKSISIGESPRQYITKVVMELHELVCRVMSRQVN